MDRFSEVSQIFPHFALKSREREKSSRPVFTMCGEPWIVKCLLSDVWYFTFFQSIFSWGEITCVWVLNLCLNYGFLQQLTRSRTVYCITRCEDNWTYWDTCQYYIIYGSIGTIWVHFKRNYNLFNQVLINVITFVLFSLYLNPILSLTQACLSLITWTVHYLMNLYWLKIKHIYIFII